MMSEKHNKGIFLSSLSIAFFAILPLMNLIIMKLIGGEEGMLGTLYIISVAFILFAATVYNRNKVMPWSSFWIILFTLLLTFVLTQGASLPSTLQPVFFAICTIVAFVSPQLVEVNSKMIIRLMASLPAIGILFFGSFIAADGSIKMNVTYAFLVPIVSSVVYCFSYIKEDKGKMKFLMIVVQFVNIFYFFMILLFGSRAPSLSVVLCILFLLCINTCNKKGFEFKRKSWIYLILPLLIVLNFSSFLQLTAKLFNKMGWEADTLERLIELDEMGALDSGRSYINNLAWKGIIDSPIWGHGMSTSEKFTGFEYPHNFILQLLLDGGIILFLIIMVPFVVRLIKEKKTCSYDEFTLLGVFFFASVPAALFSLDIWENATFWLFLGFLFSKRFHISSNQIKV